MDKLELYEQMLIANALHVNESEIGKVHVLKKGMTNRSVLFECCGKKDRICGEDYTDEIRVKVYCYVSVCGLLWSNWCEYKRTLSVDFGEYSWRQYNYAPNYYDIVRDTMGKEAEVWGIK